MLNTELIDYVLGLRPRLAAIDCDGTLWHGDSGRDFFYWELDRGLISADAAASARLRYNEYLNGKVDEETICREMVMLHAGLPEATIRAAARSFISKWIPNRIHSEVLALLHALAEAGCAVWLVSSTAAWVIEAAAENLRIPHDRVLAASVAIQHGLATTAIVRVPTGEQKVNGLRDLGAAIPDIALGNSVHDAAMLRYAHHAIAVAPDAGLQAMAVQHGWPTMNPSTQQADPRLLAPFLFQSQ